MLCFYRNLRAGIIFLSMMSGPEFKDIKTHLSFTLFAS